jgi:hypothetical protein
MADSSLHLMVSMASLAIASAAWLLRTQRQADDRARGVYADTRTGYRNELDARALQGER